MSRAAAWALSAFAAVVCASPLVDPDLWWHLTAGRELLDGALPSAETWSHTLRGAAWVDFEWLGQALLEAVRSAAGYHGLVWAKALACAAAVVGVYHAARREEASPGAAALGALLALSAVRLRAHARPELATLVLLPVFLIAARERCRRSVTLWPLVPLTALWANVHGGWPLGPGLLLLSAAGRAWAARSWRGAPAALAGWGAACALASLANPYGWEAHRVVLAHALRPPAAAGIEEWMSDGLRHFPAFWLLLAGVPARLALDLSRGRRDPLLWAVVLSPLALLALSGARFAPLFCLAAPAYVLSGAGLLYNTRGLRLGLAAGCAALAFALARPVAARRWAEPVRWERTPREALAFLDREGVSGTMYNSYAFGGYLAWAGGGRRPVYFDGRYLFQGLLEELRAGPVEEVLERRGVSYAVVPHRPLLSRERWALVWFDDAALVYLRRMPANAALIAAHEFRHVDPADPEAMLARVRSGEAPAEAVLAELARRPCAVSAALAALIKS